MTTVEVVCSAMRASTFAVLFPTLAINFHFENNALEDVVTKHDLWPRIPDTSVKFGRAIHTRLPKIMTKVFVARLEENARMEYQPNSVPWHVIQGNAGRK